MSEPWLSADGSVSVSQHLGVTKDTICTWVSSEAMPENMVGRLWRLQSSGVDEWVRHGRAAAAGEVAPS